MELHPSFQQGELFRYCVDHDIQPVGFSPIGSPARPARDVAEGDVVDIEMPSVVGSRRPTAIHPAVVCLKWAAQRGQIPIPFSVKRGQVRREPALRDRGPAVARRDRAIAADDRAVRLIKGQVFLWEGASVLGGPLGRRRTIPGWKDRT